MFARDFGQKPGRYTVSFPVALLGQPVQIIARAWIAQRHTYLPQQFFDRILWDSCSLFNSSRSRRTSSCSGLFILVHSRIGEQLNLQPSGALGLKRLGFAMDRLARAIVTP